MPTPDMSTEREFSAHYLARAGHPSVDLIADALAVEDYDTVGRLVEQLHGEMCAMLYGYLAWPKVIRNNVQASQGEHAWQELDVVARQSLPSEVPPAKQVFSEWENSQLALKDAMRIRDSEAVANGSREWHDHALAVHDAYMNYAAVLVSEVARRLGADTMQQMLTQVMDLDAMGIRPDMPFRQRVEALIKFTRLHLLPFKLVEDDEKMTFIASPCPSGGRQVLAGLYQPGGPGEMIEGESAVTYNRREMPAYCCHESALETASIKRFGSPIFIVDVAARIGQQPCHVYVYKDPASIPDQFYSRVGLTRDEDLIARH